MGDATVTLGDVKFDPTAASDFALSCEGTRGKGKSNTLAVMLEDLADVTYPTLIIERVGALLPVRVADESIIVVGGQDDPGVDLVVPIDDLDRVGSWVLDRGLKVFVDISTYADHAEQESRIHLAAARAVRSLMNRAEEKYKAPGETRTKSLLMIDEADYLAPKDNAPTPEYKGENVRRARGHIVRAATEGGNYGVSPVVAYQRRAFIANGVLNLCVDWIVHGLESDDLSRAAKSLRVDDDLLDGLGTGEIVAKGQHITDGEVVGPTKVRKRDTPDPRDETFTLPETPPEVEAALEELQDEIGDDVMTKDAESAEDRQDLRERVEHLEEENSRLEAELEAAQAGEADQALQEEVDRLKDELADVRAERDNAESAVSDLDEELAEAEDTIEQLEARVAELTALEDQVDQAAESLHDALDHLGRGDPESRETQEEIQSLREQVDRLERENERLRQRGADGVLPEDADYLEFIEQEPVKKAIQEAKDDANSVGRYVGHIIAAIVDEGGPVTYEEVASRAGIKDTSTISSDGATALETRNVITKEKGDRGQVLLDLNIGGIQDILAAKEKQERSEELLEELDL